MGRKSSIDKLPPDVRSFIERSLRENRLTLDELIEQLQDGANDAVAAMRGSASHAQSNLAEADSAAQAVAPREIHRPVAR